jgi:branched-chain amino acid transport system ATP-binding protein
MTATAHDNERLRLDAVSVRFGGLVAVRDVSVRVFGGQRWAVIGPNGAGKTTLFRTIAGEQAPTRGRVRLFGRDVTRWPANRRARAGLGRTYQVTNVFPRLSVRQNVALAAQAGRRDRLRCWWPLRLTGSLGRHVDATVDRVGLLKQRERPAGELSHGEQRQLELALGLAGSPRLLLLDEPAAGLSAADRVVMRGLVRELPADLAVVLIEHDMSLALDLVEHVLCMDDGQVIAVGTPTEIRANEQVQAVYLKSD